MTLEILIGTQNPGKLREYLDIFDGLSVRLLTLKDAGLEKINVEEPADTFSGNAEIKASAYAQASGMWALADDSGLCVHALDGRPGVYSARYAGTDASDADRRVKLLEELQDVPPAERSAHFECAIVLFNPERQTPYTATGRLTGKIALAESDGPYGFGYDALFIPDGYQQTLAEIEPDVKNSISHRAQAVRQMRPVIERLAKGLGD